MEFERNDIYLAISLTQFRRKERDAELREIPITKLNNSYIAGATSFPVKITPLEGN